MTDISRTTIAEIFRVMSARFQNQWLPKAKSEADKVVVMKIWHRDLVLLGIDDDAARVGMARAAELRWPPNPAEFARLCKPRAEDLGIPSEQLAYQNLNQVHGAYGFTKPEAFLHPTVEAAGRQIGSHVLRHSSDDNLRKLFRNVFADVVAQALRGEPLDVRKPQSLEAPEPQRRRLSPEEVRERVAAWKRENLSQEGSVSI